MITLKPSHPAVVAALTSLVLESLNLKPSRPRREHASHDAKLLAAPVRSAPCLTHDRLIELTADLCDEDLRQDVLLQCLERQPKSEAEVRTIIRRAQGLKQWHRRQDRKRTVALPDYEEPIAEEATEPLTGPVYDAVCLLPDNQRNAMLMRYVADMQVSDIAQVLGVTRQTVHRWIRDAVATIQQQGITPKAVPTL